MKELQVPIEKFAIAVISTALRSLLFFNSCALGLVMERISACLFPNRLTCGMAFFCENDKAFKKDDLEAVLFSRFGVCAVFSILCDCKIFLKDAQRVEGLVSMGKASVLGLSPR